MGAQHELLMELYPGELHGPVEKYRLESGVAEKSQWLPGLCDWKLQGPVSLHLGSTRMVIGVLSFAHLIPPT